MSFLSKFKGGYQDLWKAIIRPPRDQYAVSDLGPAEFRMKGKYYKRTDFQIKNKRGQTLECSHFEPQKRVAQRLPCVIYLHGNCSSRVEALQAIEVLLPGNITLFTLDLSGSGRSEGEYISLGWYERDDVEAVIEYLRQADTVSTIGLWGRSMGAATSIMHANRDPSIGGMVLDSPFSDLRVLAEELVKNNSKIPKLVVSGAMSLIRKTIQSKAKFDINHLVPMNHVEEGFIPALFVAGKDDKFIDQHHARDLYNKYGGDKNIVIVDGDHNSARPKFLMDSIAIFFHNTLLVDQLPKEEEKSGDKDSHKAKDQDKPKDYAPSGSGLGFREAYLNHNAYKKIGNDDEIQNMFEEVDEEELKRTIEESLKTFQESRQDQKEETELRNKPEEKQESQESPIKLNDLINLNEIDMDKADIKDEELKNDNQ